ncbi:glycosyltransferase family 4 protein [Nakamurella sp. YIM 132084]|uniref:Glycosyltransferase family 4 protein n=1 Tax=Nakamurella leprariae TaxID=2803911 RepID=A0A938YGK5_9ACTN|nr:glycosyltransferase family 4 protein [Nakamurella leprariae]
MSGARITVVGINYAPEPTGSAPYVTALARALADGGAHVHVVTGLPHYPQWRVDDPRYANGDFWQEWDGSVQVTRCRHWVPPQSSMKDRARMEASFFRRALQVLRGERPDLVIASVPVLGALAAPLAAYRRRVPVAAIIQDLTANAATQTGTVGGRLGAVIRAGEYSLYRRCARIGVINEEFRRVLEQGGVPVDKVDLTTNFAHITPVRASVSEARARLGWDPDAFLVVHTGNMGSKQGLETVVDAARLAEQRASTVQFVFVGDGNQRQVLGQRAAGVANAQFVPPLSDADYPYALAAADVLLLNELPSAITMSLPSKLTSYTAAGRPVLAATDSVSITAAFLAEQRLGEVVAGGDPQALLDAAEHLQHDEVRRHELASASRRVYTTLYGREAAEDRYRRFAGTALAGSRSRASSSEVDDSPALRSEAG